MWKQNYKNRNKGFTIIEVLVTIGIIGVLAGIGVVAVGKIRGTSQQTKCVSNLRSISHGLQLYYNDFSLFPDDGYPDDANDPLPLSTELASYIKDNSTFVCPEDNDTTSTGNFASYDPYYVARKGSYDSNELAIGCPRHRGADNSASLFSSGSTEITKIGKVQANGQDVPPDGTTAQRTINSVNDVMTFDDGSTVTVTNASGGSYGCFLVQSVRLADGTLYSIVKVQDDGAIDVQVTSGSKFEIVTPSAIVGVRGTQFTVTTSNGGDNTDVALTTGTVILMDRKTGEATTLTDGGTLLASANIQMHSHPHWHVDGTYHEHEHPAPSNAHHGNPAAGMKVAAAASDGDGDDDDQGEDDQTHIDYITDSGNTYTQVRNYCIANYPLSDAVLLAVVNRNPLLDDHANYDIFIQYQVGQNPLSETVLNAMINEPLLLMSIDFKGVLIAYSPLPQSTVDEISAGKPTSMNTSHRNAVLNAQ